MPRVNRRKSRKSKKKKIYWQYSLQMDRNTAIDLFVQIVNILRTQLGNAYDTDNARSEYTSYRSLYEIYDALKTMPLRQGVRYPHARVNRRSSSSTRRNTRHHV